MIGANRLYIDLAKVVYAYNNTLDL